MHTEQSIRRNHMSAEARKANQSGVKFVLASSFETCAYLAGDGRADLIVVRKDPTIENLTHLIRHLGGAVTGRPFELIRDIRFNPAKTQSLAESLEPHPHHTDGTFEETPPRSFILQYVETDTSGGGVNSFISIRRMLAGMPVALVESLKLAKVKFARKDDSGDTHAAVSSIIHSRGDGAVGFRWRDDVQVSPVVIDDMGTPVDQAITWVRTYLRAAPSFQYKARQGDHLICLNDRVTHSRSRLSALSPRWLRRVWIA